MQSIVFSSAVIEVQDQGFHLLQIFHQLLLNALENVLAVVDGLHVLAQLVEFSDSGVQLGVDPV